jgi:plastocyanin
MGPTLLTFNPAALSVNQGDTVIWTNAAPFTPHTSTSGSPPGTPDKLWDSGSLSQSGPKTLTMTFANFAPRTYPYYCTFHTLSGMVGSLTVTNASIPPPPSLVLPVLAANNQVRFTISGLIGQNYETQSSTDLLSWVAVHTNLALSTSFAVTNLPAGSSPNDFYRVLEIP